MEEAWPSTSWERFWWVVGCLLWQAVVEKGGSWQYQNRRCPSTSSEVVRTRAVSFTWPQATSTTGSRVIGKL